MRLSSLSVVLCLLACLALPSVSFGQLVADSVADWDASGNQGTNGWFYGFYDATADANGMYEAGDFQAFAGPTWIWTGSQWDENNADGDNVPWTEVAQTGGHPNGDNNGVVHNAIRRWVVDTAGLADIEYNISKTNPNCGNGTTALLYHNGNELASTTVAFDDSVGVVNTVQATLAVGDSIDIALSPLGTDGSLADGCDGSAFGAKVTIVPEPSALALLLLGLLALPRRRRA
jgi:hypothetical protein